MIEYIIKIISILIIFAIAFIVNILGRFLIKKSEFVKIIGKYISERKIHKIFGIFFTFIIYIAAIDISAKTIGLENITIYTSSLLSYMIKALAGVMIIIFGNIIGSHFKKTFESKINQDIFYYSVSAISIITAIPLFGIQIQIIWKSLLIIVMGLAVGLSVSFGFGLKRNIEKVIK